MHGQQVAAERGRDRLVPVEDDVQGEGDAGGGGDGPDVVVDRVAVGDAPGGTLMADPGGVVQDQDRLQRGKAGGDELGTAGEASEEVRSDEPGGDPDIGPGPRAVQPHRDAVAVGAHPGELGAVAGVVVDDRYRVHDLVAEHLPQLGVGVAAMGARSDEYHQVLRAGYAVEFGEDGGDHQLPRLRTGTVAGRDGHGLPGAHPLTQRQAGDRMAQRGRLVGRRLVADGFNDGSRGRDVDVQPACPVG